jgi:probable H4MPT-linked C1 transfer pathway protein
MTWLGLDIGGANLKAADGRGWARSVPFPLWRAPHQLAEKLTVLAGEAPKSGGWAVTMTGELCDAFRTKAEGVRHILTAAANAAAGREVRVYLVDGRLVSIDEAHEQPFLAAASNWHALARFAGRFTDDASALVVDVGSTTTDVIPLENGRPRTRWTSDTDRLLAGELVYTGVGRTPICAITQTLPWRGNECPIAAELFATTADAYCLLGDLVDCSSVAWTADGRSLTPPFARERLARMVCADATTFSDVDARQAAEFVRDVQLEQLHGAAMQVTTSAANPFECFVVSGVGEFLARRLVRELWPAGRIISLSDRLGREVSECAPAHALAVLAREAVAE